MIESHADGKRTELDADLDAETYESIGLDGVFPVCFSREEGTADTLVGWDLLKRRILVNSIRLSGAHDYHKLLRLNDFYAYEFTEGIHMTGISDDALKCVVMLVDYGGLYEIKPILFNVWLK